MSSKIFFQDGNVIKTYSMLQAFIFICIKYINIKLIYLKIILQYSILILYIRIKNMHSNYTLSNHKCF